MKKILISNVEIVTDSPAYKKKYIQKAMRMRIRLTAREN